MKTAEVTKEKVCGGFGIRYWKTIYTVTIPGEPYTFSGAGWGWVTNLCARHQVTNIKKNF